MAKKDTENKEVVENEETVVEPESTDAPEVKATADETEAPKESAKSKPKKKSVKVLADEVERGSHGTGRDRMRNLGDQYAEVQAEVNKRYIKRTRSK